MPLRREGSQRRRQTRRCQHPDDAGGRQFWLGRVVGGDVARQPVEVGMTTLLTTHDMKEADDVCGQLAILHAGRMAVVGRVAELKRQV